MCASLRYLFLGDCNLKELAEQFSKERCFAAHVCAGIAAESCKTILDVSGISHQKGGHDGGGARESGRDKQMKEMLATRALHIQNDSRNEVRAINAEYCGMEKSTQYLQRRACNASDI